MNHHACWPNKEQQQHINLMQTSPSRRNLINNPDEQICSGLGQSYESPKSFGRVRKLSGNANQSQAYWANSSFNSNGSIRLSSADSGRGSNSPVKRKEGFMPTPRRPGINGTGSGISSVYDQGSSNKSGEISRAINYTEYDRCIEESERENQENRTFEQQQQQLSGRYSSSSPNRNDGQADPETHLRRSTRHQPASSTSCSNSSTTPATSPIKVRAKVTQGVSKPKSKVKKPPPIPNVVHHGSSPTIHPDSTSSAGRGLGISLGMKTLDRDRERDEPSAMSGGRMEMGEMDQEIGMEVCTQDESFVFQDGSHDGSDQEEERESVKVHVRLRPPKPGEKCAWIPSIPSATLTLEPSLAQQRVQPGVGQPHKVDGILTGSDNQPVYVSVARPLIRAALQGYDAVIFAYGQTASGKTYTLGSTTEEGIIQKAIKDVFRGIRQSSRSREWLLRCSYLELFNEKVLDLLDPDNKPQIRDDRKKGGRGIFVSPLREEIVTNEEQIRDLLIKGQENRHVGQTDWNERSSRSHTCFKLTIESWERDPSSLSGSYDDDDDEAGDGRSSPSKEPPKSRVGKRIRVSELSLIDLAGSERYVSQGSDRRAEGSHINKSLLTLAKVIFALSERHTQKDSNSVGAHVPYRDSKLTRILQNSLSGNSKISVICTINPNPNAIDESLSTLNFAKRVKKVNLNARKNEIEGWNDGMDGVEAKALLVRYRKEMDGLKAQVKMLKRGGLGNQRGDSTPTQGSNGHASLGVGINDDRLRELKKRLQIIENLMVRGEGGENSGDEGDSVQDERSMVATTRISSDRDAVRAATTASFISDPSHILQEKLYSATRKIRHLEKKLSSRPSISGVHDDTEPELKEREQLKLIARLQNQVRELEMVCEAQSVEAPPKIREDVEREWKHRVEELENKLQEREGFVREQSEEVKRLRRANQQLIRLAHSQTSDMVNSLNPSLASTSATTSQHPTITQSAIIASQPKFNHVSRLGLTRSSAIPAGASSPQSSPRPSPRAYANAEHFGTPTSTTSRPSRFRPRRSSR